MSAVDADAGEAFGGLVIARAPDTLAPRPWTVRQSRWAADLCEGRAGPVVELFAGGGQIGLEAARLAGRHAVLVDADPTACSLARRNAATNGLADRTRVICRAVDRELLGWLRPAVLLADPPYVPSDQVDGFPEDPEHAIDGGDDGMAVVREALDAVAPTVGGGVPLLLQLGGAGQVGALLDELAALARHGPTLEVVAMEAVRHDRALVLVTARRAAG